MLHQHSIRAEYISAWTSFPERAARPVLAITSALCLAFAHCAYARSQSAEPIQTVIAVNLDGGTGNITVGSTVMKVSSGGGASWTVNPAVTSLVNGDGQFLISQPYFPNYGSQAHVIAFDPAIPKRILIGTEAVGIIASLDGGRTWGTVPGSSQIPKITSLFFDDVQKTVLVSSYARGLWNLTGIQNGPPPIIKEYPSLSTKHTAYPEIAESQPAASSSSAPHLQLVGTVAIAGHAAAVNGDTVTAYGTGFCDDPGCSSITLRVGNRVAVQGVKVSRARRAPGGTFRTTFTVRERPGRYTVTASQTAADGSTLTDSAPLIVPVVDVFAQ
jgi:hypothetical protein